MSESKQPRYLDIGGIQILKNFWYYFGWFVVAVFVGLILFRMMFVNFVDNYEVAYRYDTFGSNKGEIRLIERNGYIVTWPFKTKVHTIDGRPLQVCISSINRVLNCKLVKFNPNGMDLFLTWHGRQSYAVSSSDSGNSLTAILKAYAYEDSGKDYPFLTIVRELRPTEVEDILNE